MNKENFNSFAKRHSTDGKAEMTNILDFSSTDIKAITINIVQQVRQLSWNERKGRNIIKEIQCVGG